MNLCGPPRRWHPQSNVSTVYYGGAEGALHDLGMEMRKHWEKVYGRVGTIDLLWVAQASPKLQYGLGALHVLVYLHGTQGMVAWWLRCCHSVVRPSRRKHSTERTPGFRALGTASNPQGQDRKVVKKAAGELQSALLLNEWAAHVHALRSSHTR